MINVVLLAFLFGQLVPIINYHLLKVITWAFVICRLVLRIVFEMNSLSKHCPSQLCLWSSRNALSPPPRSELVERQDRTMAAKETTAHDQKSLNPNLGCEMVCGLLGAVYPSNLSINMLWTFTGYDPLSLWKLLGNEL